MRRKNGKKREGWKIRRIVEEKREELEQEFGGRLEGKKREGRSGGLRSGKDGRKIGGKLGRTTKEGKITRIDRYEKS